MERVFLPNFFDSLNEAKNLNKMDYQKLEEALKTYLNPSLDLIGQGVDLKEHCYYLLKKYPKADAEIWEYIETHDVEGAIDWVKTHKATDAPEKTKLSHNLKLAQQKNDEGYLDYLFQHRPKKKEAKISLEPIEEKKLEIDPEVARDIEVNDTELETLTACKLKMYLHRYIANKKLQEDSEVKVDEQVARFLARDGRSSLEVGDEVHYLKILQAFNKKYVKRFHNDDEDSSSLGDELPEVARHEDEEAPKIKLKMDPIDIDQVEDAFEMNSNREKDEDVPIASPPPRQKLSLSRRQVGQNRKKLVLN